MKKNLPTISIIVPVYKVEKYLHRCVDSILGQKFADFELILVDDGSPDHCGHICDEYACRDSRIKVIHKDNGGAAAARNAGLEIAVGKWILFCDSDDCYNENYLCEFLSCIDLEDNNTLYGFDFLNVWPDGIEYATKYSTAQIQLSNLRDNISFVSSQHSHSVIGYAIWDKLYSKEMIDHFHIRMPERGELGNKDDWCEDLSFNLQYLMAIRKVEVLDFPVYLLTKHGAQSEQSEAGLDGRMRHMVNVFFHLMKTDVYQQQELEEDFWKIVIWHIRRYFYLDAEKNGIVEMRQQYTESVYWSQLLTWIKTALKKWKEIAPNWDSVNSSDYKFLLEYLRDGNIFKYKIKSCWIWKVNPAIQKLLRRK